MVYQKRKVAVKAEGYCLTQDRERQRREQAMLFSAVADREHRPRSIGFRKTAFTHLLPAFSVKALRDITRADAERYLRNQQAGVKPATVNRERAVLSHFFSMAMRWQLVEYNPVHGTDAYAEDNERPRPLSPEEEAQLMAVLPDHYKSIVTLAINTRLRLGELRIQHWHDVDLVDSSLRVTRPKSKKPEVLPLNSTAFALLAALPQGDSLLFPGMPRHMSDMFVKYAKKAGLEDVTFHCLRDTYISRLAPHCAVPTLMTLARHRDYRTTRRYLAIDGEHLRQTVEQLVPVEP